MAHPNNRSRPLAALARAAYWQARKRVASPPLVPFYDGLVLRGYADSSVVGKVVYFGGLFDYDLMHFVLRYLRPGDRALDLGANVGVYSLLAAKAVGPHGRVDAVEAFPACMARLRENLTLNGAVQVRCHEVAISDREEEVSLVTDRGVANHIAAAGDEGHQQMRVRTTTMAAILAEGPPCALVKMDIEGSEYAALKGSEELLAAHHPPAYLFEAVPSLLQRQGATRTAILDLFERHDFAICQYDADRNELVPPDYWQRDLIAIARPSLADVRARLRH